MKVNVRNVDKSFGAKKAVSNVDLVITPGTMHGLLGSNGAGKTTFMKTLMGIYKTDSGEVLFDDKNIYENTEMKSEVIFIQDIPFFFASATLNKMAEFTVGSTRGGQKKDFNSSPVISS